MMLSGIAESIELCRRSRVQGNWYHMVYSEHGLCARWDPERMLIRKLKPSQPVRDPERFVRRPRRTKPKRESHRNEPLLPGDGEDGVVAPWSPGGWVDEEVDGVVGDPARGLLGEHDVHVGGAEDLLERVEGEPAELALDEVGAVLHDRLKLDVTIPRLPSWDEVEHVGAVGRLPVFTTLCAGQCHAEDAEKWEICDLVPHAEEARVEVDLRGEGRDGEEAGGADDQERRDRLVEEAWINVGRLLEDDDVAPGALGGADLPGIEVCGCAKCVRSGRGVALV
jgi:hypothetical protein